MNTEKQISGLVRLADFIRDNLTRSEQFATQQGTEFEAVLKKTELENYWFTKDNLEFCLKNWADILNERNIKNWLKNYKINNIQKRIGLILAGNIPLVGFHDVICVVLSGHFPVIKLSSKDKILLPFLLKKWREFSENSFDYELVERLSNFDAVIATGSNNTAQYLESYFKNVPSIIRKNRTSVAVLSGKESDGDLKKLADDIFRYFGLGCRNVTRMFIPNDFELSRLFENFMSYKDLINHNGYANNYDYNRAIYLLNQNKFWDNNFVMLKEDDRLFSPLSVLNFSRYNDIKAVEDFIDLHREEIQCIVCNDSFFPDGVRFGDAQNPSLDTYADNVDTMKFLEVI